jgi:RNA polymerase sigma-70 factor (ECF subfamily)
MLNLQVLGTYAIGKAESSSALAQAMSVKWLPRPLSNSSNEIRQDGDDDSRLVSETLSGNLKSYEALVRRYQKLVYNVIYQMVLNHESASDLTQDTFLKAFKALSNFRLEARFKPWLLRIASNGALNYIRDRKEAGSLDEMLEENPASEPASSFDVEREVEWRLSQGMLSDALAQLSPRHRQFFVLRYQHDLSYDDISQITGEPESTIKPLLFRIREKLRKLLAEKMGDNFTSGGD